MLASRPERWNRIDSGTKVTSEGELYSRMHQEYGAA